MWAAPAATMLEDVDQELADLADAYGVATHYENSEQREVTVDDDVVVAVLAQFDVDAGTPGVGPRRAGRGAAGPRRTPRCRRPSWSGRAGHAALPGPAVVWLEDGGRVEVTRHLPADLPLGWHRLVTADQDVVLAVVPGAAAAGAARVGVGGAALRAALGANRGGWATSPIWPRWSGGRPTNWAPACCW